MNDIPNQQKKKMSNDKDLCKSLYLSIDARTDTCIMAGG